MKFEHTVYLHPKLNQYYNVMSSQLYMSKILPPTHPPQTGETIQNAKELVLLYGNPHTVYWRTTKSKLEKKSQIIFTPIPGVRMNLILEGLKWVLIPNQLQ